MDCCGCSAGSKSAPARDPLCRAALRQREIVHRRKHGFGVPVAEWFRTDLRDMLHEQLTANDDGARWFEPRVVQCMLDEHTSDATNWSTQLWPLFVFRLWYRATRNERRHSRRHRRRRAGRRSQSLRGPLQEIQASADLENTD